MLMRSLKLVVTGSRVVELVTTRLSSNNVSRDASSGHNYCKVTLTLRKSWCHNNQRLVTRLRGFKVRREWPWRPSLSAWPPLAVWNSNSLPHLTELCGYFGRYIWYLNFIGIRSLLRYPRGVCSVGLQCFSKAFVLLLQISQLTIVQPSALCSASEKRRVFSNLIYLDRTNKPVSLKCSIRKWIK